MAKIIKPKIWESPYLNDTYLGLTKYYSYGKLRWLLELSEYHKENSVLDFGCGFGYFLLTLLNEFNIVYAVDFNPNLEDKNQESLVFVNSNSWKRKPAYKNLFDVVKDLLSIENTSTNYELIQARTIEEYENKIPVIHNIFAVDVFEHIKDRRRTYAVLSSKLKKDGVLVYSVPNTCGPMFYLRILLGFVLGLKEDPDTNDHKEYNWKTDLTLVNNYFSVKKVIGYPFYFKSISPTIIVKCMK